MCTTEVDEFAETQCCKLRKTDHALRPDVAIYGRNETQKNV